jgi:hypothetical protein
MSGRSTVGQVVDLYFEGLNNDNAAVIPLADDVVFAGPMLPEPIIGEAAVRQHLADVAPFVARMDRKLLVIEGDSAAVTLEFEGVNGVVIEGAEFFRIRDRKISFVQAFFDTRPLLKGAS